MKITAELIDATTAWITLAPSWLGRLFGHRIRRGRVHRAELRISRRYGALIEERPGWCWDATERWVGDDIEGYLETPTVETLPAARSR